MSLGPQLSGFTSFASTDRSPSAVQMSGSSPPTAPRACCENGRPILTDPHTGQTVCSCQYGSALLNYPRVAGLAESVYSASAYAAAVSQGYVSLGAEGSAFYSPLAGSPYDLKDGAEAWRTLAQPPFPYDPAMAVYPYGAGYGGLDLNSRRKNATRENTNTLKAWLYEHRKNPYPTKGEKIMLAIITKMTLTQVSTWFANARRRLKKENKMTWSPRNRSEDGADSVNGEAESDSEKAGDGNDVSSNHGDLDARLPRDGRGSPGADSEAGGSQERIINVEDEDSSHSFLHHHHDLMDHKAGDDDDDDEDDDDFPKHSREERESRDSPNPLLSGLDPAKVRAGSPRPSTEVRDSREGERGSSPDPRGAGQSESSGGAASAGGAGGSASGVGGSGSAPPRPKIWSISEVLQTSSTSSSSGPSRPATISTAARPSSHNPPGGYFLLPASAPSAWAAGVGARYGAMAGYPLSLSHSTLSYPYSLSSHSAAKAALHPATAVSRSLATLRGEAEKLTRPNGLFSPARDIDCIRSPDRVSPYSLSDTDLPPSSLTLITAALGSPAHSPSHKPLRFGRSGTLLGIP